MYKSKVKEIQKREGSNRKCRGRVSGGITQQDNTKTPV